MLGQWVEMNNGKLFICPISLLLSLMWYIQTALKNSHLIFWNSSIKNLLVRNDLHFLISSFTPCNGKVIPKSPIMTTSLEVLSLWLFATPWPIHSMEFSRPEFWSGLPCPPPGDLPNPGTDPRSPTLQVYSLPAEPSGKPKEALKDY